MQITCSDGAVFEGANAKEIVARMRADDWSAPPTKQAYMIETAERVHDISGGTIGTSSAEEFLVDLEHAGWCRIEFLTPVQAAQYAALISVRSEPGVGGTEESS